MIQIIEKNIQKSFSKSALFYEKLSGLQRTLGDKLVLKGKNIKEGKKYNHILDVGMGTGRMTHQLSRTFAEAKIFGVDFASGMVDFAKRKYDSFYTLQADARRLPFCKNSFDIIFSNSAYQWVQDLDGAFKEVYSALKSDGTFCLAMFAKNSLSELFESLKQTFSPRVKTQELSIKRLPAKEQIYKALEKNKFRQVELKTELIKVKFADMFSLMRWLKRIGANAGSRNIYLGKNRFMEANKYYCKNFNDKDSVYATFEVVWINAIK